MLRSSDTTSPLSNSLPPSRECLNNDLFGDLSSRLCCCNIVTKSQVEAPLLLCYYSATFTRHHQRKAVICQPENLTETLGSLVYRFHQAQEEEEEKEEESVLYVEEVKTKIIRIR